MVCSKIHFVLSVFALRMLAASLWFCLGMKTSFEITASNETVIFPPPSCRRKQSSQTPFKARHVLNSTVKPKENRGRGHRENSYMCCWFARGLQGFISLRCEQTARHFKLGKPRREQGCALAWAGPAAASGPGVQQGDAARIRLHLWGHPESCSSQRCGSWFCYPLPIFK